MSITVSSYRHGWFDGVRECLAQLNGDSSTVQDGMYDGPMPDELKLWIEKLRDRLDKIEGKA